MQDEHKADEMPRDDNGFQIDDEATLQVEGDEAIADEAMIALEEKVAALSEQVIRERAENDNLRKRQARELQSAHKFATERLIKDLLPVLDSLTLGIDAAKNGEHNAEAIEQFIEGSEMTLKLLNETLAKHGVETINPEGEKFNPEQHEAVASLPNADAEPNSVLHVTQRGYVLNGRVIRAAQVVIAKAAD
ncbi:nucleotide exchange factor GrpE [Suttonella sp. R2A3]|uniref:nucleotide exchange factor GrpE n=1 Tax=Suttonella sp. R2A3 TaxID=2908648 RepID=UPI001F1F1E54|nr:nucleotide exchange factor GrpE [Suttonella sp. R2A3]UJF24526.1 nucleotide exchange factor GrpE [Suttonella sp. R2A3]